MISRDIISSLKIIGNIIEKPMFETFGFPICHPEV
jgi:hypothetical protein